MSGFGQIQRAFWIHPDTRSLSLDAKLIAAYLLTGPDSNGLGCFFMTPETVAGRLRMPGERASKGYAELYRNGFVKHCERTDYTFIPNFLKWNPIANGKVATARLKELREVPSTFAYLADLIEDCKRFGNHWPKGFDTVCDSVSISEPIRTDPNPPDPKGASPPRARARRRRWGEDEEVPEEWIEWGIRETNLAPNSIRGVAAEFADYWRGTGKPMADWRAVWRNRCRAVAARGTPNEPRKRRGAMERTLDGIQRFMENADGTRQAENPDLPLVGENDGDLRPSVGESVC